MCNTLKKTLVPYRKVAAQEEVASKKVKHGGSLPSRKVLSHMVHKDTSFDSSMPIMVGEVKARYRFGVKSTSAQVVNWKGNIPVIKLNFNEPPTTKSLNHSEIITSSPSKKRHHHHHHASKKIKCGNKILIKSATTEEISPTLSSSPKPLRKKHHSCKGLNHHNSSRDPTPPKVVSVSHKQLPPPPKTVTTTTTTTSTTNKLITKSCREVKTQRNVTLLQPQVLPYPTFPPFNIKLQFKL